MSDEFEDISSRIPDLSTALAQRIAAKQAGNNASPVPNGAVDPYAVMLKKKSEGGEVVNAPLPSWPEADVKKLQDYCTKMGIIGFSAGRMNPIAALAQLKAQLGDDYTGVPLEERVPAGYERRGTTSKYGPNFPYGEAMKRKQILHG
jgi:hypothetical protein